MIVNGLASLVVNVPNPGEPASAVASTITSSALDNRYFKKWVHFEFSNSADFSSLVTPSAGTITLTASANGQVYDAVYMGTAFSAATSGSPLSILGPASYMQAVPTGLAGATYWRMVITMAEGG
jgi:hypothetical protein